jgi:Kef-type K+ transport system membrane component KefB
MATNYIGIFAIFGAFLAGTALSDELEFRAAVSKQLRNFVTVFFLPIFFTYTGLRTNIGTLESPVHWLMLGGVLFVAIFGKLGGCTVAARLGGYNTREALLIGTMMNTRALMELIVINVGRNLGVITDSVFCMLVIMALVTTVMTTPLVMWFMRGTELEPHIKASGFLGTRS